AGWCAAQFNRTAPPGRPSGRESAGPGPVASAGPRPAEPGRGGLAVPPGEEAAAVVAPAVVVAVPAVAALGAGLPGAEAAPGDLDGVAATAAGGQGPLVGDLGLREVLRLAGDVDGEGEVLAGQLAAPAAVVVALVGVLVGRSGHARGRGGAGSRRRSRVGGDLVTGRIGRRLVGGGQVGGVAVVPRRQLVEQRGPVVGAGRRGGLGAGLEALALFAPGGPGPAPLDRAGHGDDAGLVLGQAGDAADEALAGPLAGAVGEADHAAGVGRLVAAAAPDLDPVGLLGLLGPAHGPAGHGQFGVGVLTVTATVVVSEVGAGVV